MVVRDNGSAPASLIDIGVASVSISEGFFFFFNLFMGRARLNLTILFFG